MHRRLLWFLALWLAGVAAVGVVALLIRLVFKPAAAAEPGCADAVALLRPDLLDTPALLRAQPGRCAVAAWPDRRLAVAVARDDTLLVGLVRGAPGFETVEASVEIEALALDPLESPSVEILPVPVIGPMALGVRLLNRAEAPGRRTETEALHVLLPREDVLEPVLAVLLRAEHAAEHACPRGRPAPCRTAWSRRWTLEAAGPAHGGTPPDLVLRDGRGGAVASRHRWTGQGYSPAVFERTPPLGPR